MYKKFITAQILHASIGSGFIPFTINIDTERSDECSIIGTMFGVKEGTTEDETRTFRFSFDGDISYYS